MVAPGATGCYETGFRLNEPKGGVPVSERRLSHFQEQMEGGSSVLERRDEFQAAEYIDHAF
jgi:hypothetical protein